MLDLRLNPGRRGRKDRDGFTVGSFPCGVRGSQAAPPICPHYGLVGFLHDRSCTSDGACWLGHSVASFLACVGRRATGRNRDGAYRQGHGPRDAAYRVQLSNPLLGVRNAAPDCLRHLATCTPQKAGRA